MYYISGKNLVEQNGQPVRGWSIVNNEGVVYTTMVGGMGLKAAIIVCEQLNNNSDKYNEPLNTKKMCILNYDDNKIIWTHSPILQALYFSTTGDLSVNAISTKVAINVDKITKAIEFLVEEGWVLDENAILSSTEEMIYEGKYRLSFMGRIKLEWLTGLHK